MPICGTLPETLTNAQEKPGLEPSELPIKYPDSRAHGQTHGSDD